MNRDTSEIRIRPYREDDGTPLYEAARESISSMQPWMPWCHADYSPEEAQVWVANNCRQTNPIDFLSFVIEDGDGAFLGGCGLNDHNPRHRLANLGYWLRLSARGRGVMTRAVRLLRDYAFNNTDLDRLEIVAAVGNLPSQRVAERVGAVREGLLRQALLLNGERYDAILYSILRSDSNPPV
ncbi:MAG: GNAT family N-acetyltransferase [Planctomycetaceae bacterium]